MIDNRHMLDYWERLYSANAVGIKGRGTDGKLQSMEFDAKWKWATMHCVCDEMIYRRGG